MTLLIDITENDYEQCIEAYKYGSRDRLVVAISEGQKVDCVKPNKHYTAEELQKIFDELKEYRRSYEKDIYCCMP